MNLEKEVFELAVEDIMPNRFQPREIFDDESINELAQSIKEHGVIQPIIVRKIGDKYEIVAGERRLRASKVAGKTTIPALIRNINDKESAKIALLENLQRKNLTAIEEAKTYQTIIKLDNLTQEELANTLGKSQSTIANKLRLLSLDNSVQDALLKEQISERHARSLLNITDLNQQKQLLEKTILNRMTVKQLDDEIAQITGKKVEIQEDDNENIPVTAANLFNENEIKSDPMNQTNIFTALRKEPTEQPVVNDIPLQPEIPSYGDNQINIDSKPVITDIPVVEPIVTEPINPIQPETQPIEPTFVSPVINQSEVTQPINELNPVEPVNPSVVPATPVIPPIGFGTAPVAEPIKTQPEIEVPQQPVYPPLPTLDQNTVQPEPIIPVVPPVMETPLPEIKPTLPVEKPVIWENSVVEPIVPQPEVVSTPDLTVAPTIDNPIVEQQPDLFSNIDKLINEEVNKEPVVEQPVEEKQQPVFVPPVTPIENTTQPGQDIYDLRFAINNFRQAVQNTEKFGFNIETEEFDFDNVYQFIIKIDKNK